MRPWQGWLVVALTLGLGSCNNLTDVEAIRFQAASPLDAGADGGEDVSGDGADAGDGGGGGDGDEGAAEDEDAAPAVDQDQDGDPAGSDCDDNDPARHQGAAEVCGNGVDEDCSGLSDDDPVCDGIHLDDIDQDGVPNALDCDGPVPGVGELPGRYDAGRTPGREEVCGNGVDENCALEANGQADLPCRPLDRDRDGHLGPNADGPDCNDQDPTVAPGAPERCGDGIDQDCDGADAPCGEDADGDGFDVTTDCDDSDPAIHPPGRTIEGGFEFPLDLCDARDNDCDGVIDEGNPLWFTGACDPDDPLNTCNTLGEIHTRALRCGSDEGECAPGWSVCARSLNGEAGYLCVDTTGPIEELCDTLDNDCDGVADEGVTNACGGCTPLPEEPGSPCGICGELLCVQADALLCWDECR